MFQVSQVVPASVRSAAFREPHSGTTPDTRKITVKQKISRNFCKHEKPFARKCPKSFMSYTVCLEFNANIEI